MSKTLHAGLVHPTSHQIQINRLRNQVKTLTEQVETLSLQVATLVAERNARKTHERFENYQGPG